MGFCDGLRFMGFVYVGIEPDGILWYDINIEVCRVAFSCPEAENTAAAEGNPSAAMGTECTGGRQGEGPHIRSTAAGKGKNICHIKDIFLRILSGKRRMGSRSISP